MRQKPKRGAERENQLIHLTLSTFFATLERIWNMWGPAKFVLSYLFLSCAKLEKWWLSSLILSSLSLSLQSLAYQTHRNSFKNVLAILVFFFFFRDLNHDLTYIIHCLTNCVKLTRMSFILVSECTVSRHNNL